MASMVDEQVLGGAFLTPEGAIPLSPEEAKAILETRVNDLKTRMMDGKAGIADIEEARRDFDFVARAGFREPSDMRIEPVSVHERGNKANRDDALRRRGVELCDACLV